MSREKALCDLLGTDNPVPPSEYPDELTLPQHLHSKILSALDRTVNDGHERSLHFRHRRDRWYGGLAVKGTQYDIASGAHISWMHLNSTIFYPPHVHVHTHPLPDEGDIRNELEKHNSIIGGDKETLRRQLPFIQKSSRALSSLPSGDDVFRSLNEPMASIANLVAAESGSFLWVHRDINSKALLVNSFSAAFFEKRSRARNSATYIGECDGVAFQNLAHATDIRQQLLDSRVEALRSAYVCYSSKDPDSTSLVKVENVPTGGMV